ncbi:MAG: phosphatase PAP2 family protein [Ilumatobacter sp.]|uniref:phosphatase PAP2 family protein n=1 Tax=Ilumatobacter sp. TaxID=1967498 RepID=UPI003C73D913
MGFVVLAAGLSLLGVLGRLTVFEGAIGDAEADFVAWTADRRTSTLDSVFTIGSTLSDTWTIVGVVVGAVTMLLATGHARHAVTIILAVLLEFSSFLVVGAVVDRERPDVEALHSVPSTPSFPSGHVAAAFVLYGSLALVARTVSSRPLPRALWLLPLFVALLVGASRVYEGVHNPTDVGAGLLLGAGALAAATTATGLQRFEGPVDHGTESIDRHHRSRR